MLDAVMIPIVINKRSYVPRATSVMTMAGIFLFAFIFFDEGLYLGGASEFIGGVAWMFIVVYRGGKK